jgi:preprotein translocase subunit YajC
VNGGILIILALVLGVMYVVMIRPQRQRQAQHQSAIDSARVGDEVVTTGGIYGTIVETDGDDVVVEIDPKQGVNVHMTRRGIAAVLPPEEEEREDENGEEEALDEGDEGVVTDDEDAVRSVSADAVSDDGHR